jgi:hypothetical protein
MFTVNDVVLKAGLYQKESDLGAIKGGPVTPVGHCAALRWSSIEKGKRRPCDAFK